MWERQPESPWIYSGNNEQEKHLFCFELDIEVNYKVNNAEFIVFYSP